MNKIVLSCFLMLAAGMVTAEEIVRSDNVIGVMAVQSEKTATIVAVPFRDFDGGDLRLVNLIKTANLTPGDRLYRYDPAKDGFDGWVLAADADGVLRWEKNEKVFRVGKSGELTTDDGLDANEVTAAQGSGVWLVRASAPSSPFVFYLQGSVSAAEAVTVEAGKVVLLGNPTDRSAAPTITGMSNGDTVQLATAGGLLNVYTYSTAKKQWGYWDADNRPVWVDSPMIPAGIGFWYVAKGGDVTVEWK